MPTFSSDLDMAGNELRNARFEVLADFPADPALGQQFFYTGEDPGVLFYWNGEDWQRTDGLAEGGVAPGVLTVNGRAGNVTLAKADVGLSAVDNTSDLGKPISTAQSAFNIALNNRIAAEETARSSADTELETSVSNEASQRIAGDEQLTIDLAAAIESISPFSYTHTQETPQSVWQIEHNLGYDPSGVVVISDGYMLDGFVVEYLTPGQTLRLTFEIAVAGIARLS